MEQESNIMEQPKAFTIKTAVFYAVLVFLLQIVLGIALAFLYGVVVTAVNPEMDPGVLKNDMRSSGPLYAVMFIVSELMIFLVALRVRNKFRNTFRGMADFTNVSLPLAGLVVLFSILYVVPSSELENIFAALFGRATTFAETVINVTHIPGAMGLVVSILVVAALPAIVEELLFRGLIQKNLSARYGDTKALWTASFLFMIVHVNPTALASIFLLSLMLGYVYMKTGNLAYSIMLHFCNNLISALMSRYDAFDIGGMNMEIEAVQHVSPYLLVPAVLLAVAVVYAIVKFFEINRPGVDMA